MKIVKEALAVYLTQEFTAAQADFLAQVISDSYLDLVKTSDFTELKAIVERLAIAQERSERRLDALTDAQLRTEKRMDQIDKHLEQVDKRLDQVDKHLGQVDKHLEQVDKRLDQADKRMERLENRMDKLETTMAELAIAVRATTDAVQALTRNMEQVRTELERLDSNLVQTRSELRGLGKSFGYALENEAYRALPAVLARRYGIEVKDHFVRTFVGEREINLLGEGEQNGERVLIVGETKVQLGTDDLRQLDDSVDAVWAAQEAGELPGGRIIRLWVTHVARPAAKKRAEALGMLVIESFQW